MIVALLFFALVSAFTAAASVMLMGFSFWIALISYPLAGMTALIAFGKTLSRTPQNHRKPAHA
jgi:membrane protein implicated in regulation of membrane protease activity